MLGRWKGWHDCQVEICIVFDAIDPPVGRVRLPDGGQVEFAGWLGLLEVLSQLAERAGS